MWARVRQGVGRVIGVMAAAIRTHPILFGSVVLAVCALDLLLPPLVLSLARKPVDFFSFNPWLKRLPEYLASDEDPFAVKLEKLARLPLFWYSADSPYGGTEWGFSADVRDLARFLGSSLLIGTYFVLWTYRRERTAAGGWSPGVARGAALTGTLGSVLGLSTGPCSVMGCGAPVLPVLGLAFTGLTSGTLALLAATSRIATSVILLALALGVVGLAWSAPLPAEGRAATPTP